MNVCDSFASQQLSKVSLSLPPVSPFVALSREGLQCFKLLLRAPIEYVIDLLATTVRMAKKVSLGSRFAD
jgi:hypothetical protein